MDRSNRFDSYEHETGTHQSDWYRQSMSSEDEGGSAAARWGYIAAGALMLGLGGYLFYRGASELSEGSSQGGGGKRALERAQKQMGRMKKGSRDNTGVQVREQITVSRPVSELYRFWRDVENLPRVMGYLESVTKSDDRHSHWVAKGPAGQRIEWDAEVTDARENELVSWRSLENSDVPNEGSVRFSRSGDSGTVIDVALTYHPPAGKAGAAVAKFFGKEPGQEIRRDLERFKQRVESGNLILRTSGTSGSMYSG